MKRIFAVALCFALLLVFPSDVTAVATSAGAFALVDADTGIVLTQHNGDKRMKMASTTKIMTTLLALEYAQQDNMTVTFTKDMVAEGSSMYLKVGDKVKLTDLAAGMMMASGNDAANAVSLSLAESFEDFAGLMNQRAAEIGMKNTHFVTPSGLDDDMHYSTAYDMALLMAEAMKNQSFISLTSSKEKTVSFVYPTDRVVTYQNHNRLLSLYSHCTGGKTGFTKASGRCLVTSAEKNGVRLIAVTLNAPDDWNDHISLYEYGFSLYSKVILDDTDKCFTLKVAGGNESTLKASPCESVGVNIPSSKAGDIKTDIYLPKLLFAPVNKGDEVGRVTYKLNGVEIMSVSIKAEDSVTKKEPTSFLRRLFSAIFNRE